jgi:hypothetical protein
LRALGTRLLSVVALFLLSPLAAPAAAQAAAPAVVTEPASSLTQTSATLNASVNPKGEEVSECKFEYGTTLPSGKTAPCTPSPGNGTSPVAVSAAVSGLTTNTTYHFRISATNPGGTSEGSDETFKTLPETTPTVETKAPSSFTQTTATLSATVNPNGGKVSKCEFEYGTTTAYGQIAQCSALPGSGSSPVEVTGSVTGLAANTMYHFRISATNQLGTNQGADQSFETLPPTPPTVVTELASSPTQTSATLNATVNPNGGEVSECKFEYGITTAYTASAPCMPSPGSVTTAVPVSAPVTGLSANTIYHFRMVATNSGGTGQGADQSFTTLSVMTSPQQGPANPGTPAAQAVLSSQEYSAGSGAKTAGAPTVVAAETGANSVTLTVRCRGTSSQTCDGDASLYGTEHRLASRIVSLSRKRPRTVMVLVGHLRFTLHAGQTLTLTLRLNPTGRTLLRRFGRLPVKLVVRLNKANGGKLIVIGKGTIGPPHKHKRRH